MLGSFATSQVNGLPITVAVGNVMSEDGFSLLMSPDSAESVWKTILSQGAIPMGSNAWEKLRVFRGSRYLFNLLVFSVNLPVASMNKL